MSDEETKEEVVEAKEQDVERDGDAIEAELEALAAKDLMADDDEPEVDAETEDKTAEEKETPASKSEDEAPQTEEASESTEDHPAAMRIAKKEIKQEIADLRAELDGLKATKDEAAVVEEPKAEREATPSQVVQLYQQAEENGNEMGMRQAVEWINQYATRQEIAELTRNAQSGIYGTEGLDLIHSVLAPANIIASSREADEIATKQREADEQRSATSKVEETRNKETERVKADFPDLFDAKSETGKAAREIYAELAGGKDADGNEVEGIFDQEALVYLHQHPYQQAALVSKMLKSRSSIKSDESAKDKEIAELKAKLNIADSPEGESKPGPKSEKTKRSVVDVENELEAAMRQASAA